MWYLIFMDPKECNGSGRLFIASRNPFDDLNSAVEYANVSNSGPFRYFVVPKQEYDEVWKKLLAHRY